MNTYDSFHSAIQVFAGRIFQAAQQGIPGILGARGRDTALVALGHIAVPDIRAPMQIRHVKKVEPRRAGRLAPVCIGDIMTGQRAGNGVFSSVSIRARFTR